MADNKQYYYLGVVWTFKGEQHTSHFVMYIPIGSWYDRLKNEVSDRFIRPGYEVDHWDGYALSSIEYSLYYGFCEQIT